MFNKGEGWKDVEAKVSHTVNMRQLHSLGGVRTSARCQWRTCSC